MPLAYFTVLLMMRYFMLRYMLMVILSANPAFGGVVDGVKKSKNRILVGLEGGEVGLFQFGDELEVKIRRSPQRFKARVVKVFGRDLVAIKPTGKVLLPKKNQRVDLTPTYRNKFFDNDVGIRAPGGQNRYEERNIVALEAGTHAKFPMLGFGGRYHIYTARNQSFTLGYSMGQEKNAKVLADAEMGSIQTRYFFGPRWHITGGVGLKRSTVIINPELIEKVRDGEDEDSIADIPFENENVDKIANVVEEVFLETGFGSMFSFRTTTVGNVLVLGVDWLTVQAALHQEIDDKVYNEALEKAYPLKDKVNMHSRLYVGFSF